MNHDNKKFAWKYINPSDINSSKEIHGKTLPFCLHCIYRYTKKRGFYNLTHPYSKHQFKENKESSVDGGTNQEATQASLADVPVEISSMSFAPPNKIGNLGDNIGE